MALELGLSYLSTPPEIEAARQRIENRNKNYTMQNDYLNTLAGITKNVSPWGSLGMLFGTLGANMYNNYLQRRDERAVQNWRDNNMNQAFMDGLSNGTPVNQVVDFIRQNGWGYSNGYTPTTQSTAPTPTTAFSFTPPSANINSIVRNAAINALNNRPNYALQRTW